MRSTLAVIFGLALTLFVAASPASGQLPVGRIPARPMVGNPSITVSASPSSTSFHLLASGVAAASSTINITTTMGGCPGGCTVLLWSYFSSATAALSGGSPIVNIPSSAVLGMTPSGGGVYSFTPYTQTAPYGGAGAALLLAVQFETSGTTGNYLVALNLEINLAGLPQVPAGSYTGTLYLEVESY